MGGEGNFFPFESGNVRRPGDAHKVNLRGKEDSNFRMGGCDHSFCFTLLLIFQFSGFFPLKNRSLGWETETLWHQGRFVTGLLPGELDSGAVCAVFSVKHRGIKL